MGRIVKAFSALRGRREGALVGYLTGGDPDLELSKRCASAVIEAGVDILELGIPFSDPVADGPTIQAASNRALASGVNPSKVLELVRELRSANDLPIVLLTYYNPVYRLGVENFLRRGSAAGADGIIIVDLPVEEAGPELEVARSLDLDTIFLVAPSTPDSRIPLISSQSRGFLYMVSHYGVTGVKEDLQEGLTLDLLRRVKAGAGGLPVVVGFGIGRPQQVRRLISGGADGVIVGSALVEVVAGNLGDPQEALKKLGERVKELKAATIGVT